ncbi:hypothetical protein CLOSCI_00037 [[Clostridium] scindens ATCC 35704]|nr:hypothetical protein CLOSCI_00037 [[Clostridium] scindens ATCC 35704]
MIHFCELSQNFNDTYFFCVCPDTICNFLKPGIYINPINNGPELLIKEM